MDKKIKNEDYYPTGATESALIYYYGNTIGAAKSVNEKMFVLNEDGLSRWFVGKKGMDLGYRDWLNIDAEKYEEEYKKWSEHWKIKEPVLYGLLKNHTPWLEAWNKIDSISEKFWLESYGIEVVDPYAEELQNNLKKAIFGVKDEELQELITPSSIVATQTHFTDSKKVKKDLSLEDFLRKYWYINGTWSGGELLDESGFNRIKEVNVDFDKALNNRKKIHKKFEKDLAKEVFGILHKLRTVFSWREERKIYLQMMNVCLYQIAKRGAEETGLTQKAISWLRPEELKLSNRESLAESRIKKSAFLAREGKGEFVSSEGLNEVFSAFKVEHSVSELRGIVASKGFVQGRVRVILKQHHFHRFQNGEILVTTMTRPEFVPLMSKASAVITEEGGLTSHAAIVSRELKIPCIVGTKIATSVLKDGDMAEVDAEKGVVRIINRK